ncbi:MAG: methylmalonyl Co-A mutase-associated GTPase MeaB [Acidobacteriaceae bacterium]|nr:methylmalonyl Co-A mutase-associated GTPase MeaB [Acidobacteriaceae bacterium]
MNEITSTEREAAELVQRVRAGDVRALARAVSVVEQGGATATAVLSACHAADAERKALRIGFTGPPGAGKSTLVDRYARLLRAHGETVGVAAVDPTSPFHGGAILGDRIRMQGEQEDAGLYIRSVATRGTLGGLATATADICTVIEASGKSRMLIETVGVGQDEVEIARLADVTVVVLVPGMGDDVQSIKAGLMEIADIFVINKCDREGADRVESDVRAMQSLVEANGWTPPVVRTVATTGEGVAALEAAVQSYVAHGAEGVQARRQSTWGGRLLQMAQREILRQAETRGVNAAAMEGYAAEVAAGANPYELVQGIVRGALGGAEMKLDHLGVAVKSIAEARRFYETLGLRVEHEETVEHEQVKTAMLPLGETRIELLEPTAAESVIGKYLAKRGEGLHHIAVHVEDVDATMQALLAAGARLVNTEVRTGAGGHRYFFVHPASTGGVLLEIVGAKTQ